MAFEGLSISVDLLPKGVTFSGTARISVPAISIPIPVTLQGIFWQQASSSRFGSTDDSLQPDQISQQQLPLVSLQIMLAQSFVLGNG